MPDAGVTLRTYRRRAWDHFVEDQEPSDAERVELDDADYNCDLISIGHFSDFSAIDLSFLYSSRKKRSSGFLERLKMAVSRFLRPLVLFDRNGSGLDKRMLVVVRFPVSFVAVPIAFVIAVPIFVIPIVIPTVLVSFRWK